MKKSIKLIAGLTAAILTLGVAGCTKDTNYPNFVNTNISGNVPEAGEKYVINVESEGGLKLDGVIVSAKNKEGRTVKRGMTANGKIELGIALGEYDLEVDETSLPAGYSVTDVKYVTNSQKREEITIKVRSQLLPSNSSQNSFAVGQIMKDFTFNTCDNKNYTLSDLLKTKKAVVLNFWYTGCGPCRSEFPALERAYSTNKSSVEVLAICSTHQGDTNAIVSKYRDENNLTMPMGIDTQGLSSLFSVGSFPTTVIIDRYGMVAARNVGSEPDSAKWSAEFRKYAADNYVQSVAASGSSSETPGFEIAIPDVSMPASQVFEEALNGEGTQIRYRADDDEYSWPWLIEEDKNGMPYAHSSNNGKGNSYSILRADVTMKANQVLSFEYNVESEAGRDLLYVFLNGDIINGDGWSATDGWHDADIYIAAADETVELAFLYRKDPADPDQNDPDAEDIGSDEAKIRNIHLYDVSQLENSVDVLRPCASGEKTDDFRYSDYVSAVKDSNGFFHKDTVDGPLIMITVSQFTAWSELHTGDTSTDANGTVTYNTLYSLTYDTYATGSGASFNVTIGGVNITDTITTYFPIQGIMEGPFYLIPVNDKLRVWAEKFAEDYEKKHGNETHENEWLEFCYYYQHYSAHDHVNDADKYYHENNETCRAITDATFGLTTGNSYKAYLKADAAQSDKYNEDTGRLKVDIRYPLQTHNGVYFNFTAPQTGVYQFRAYTRDYSSQDASSSITVYDKNMRYIASGSSVRDFDRLTGEVYDGFNTYAVLDEGETYNLFLGGYLSEVSHYEFEITYVGEELTKMFICSTGEGQWTFHEAGDGSIVGQLYYLGIDYAYDEATDQYYAADRHGEPIWDKPIYIAMTQDSFLYSTYVDPDDPKIDTTWRPLAYFIETRGFKNLKFGNQIQTTMENYLKQAKSENNDLPYGLVRANREIVDYLNRFIDVYADGKGEGNGWLAFACYEEHFGK